MTRQETLDVLVGNRAWCTVAITLCALLGVAQVSEAQWLQWGGPQRNFVAKDGKVAATWPTEGPKKLWNRELGDGYGTILVDGGVLYTMYRVDQDEFTIALDAKTGKTIWEHKNPSPTTPLMEEFGAGPSATPLVVGDRLYTIGTNMVFHCFNKKSGEVHWKHDLAEEFEAEVPGRGYSSSPLAYKDTVILPVGGKEKEGQSMVAFHQETGSVAWKNQSFGITHSSPILIRFNGQDQLVYFSSTGLIGMNPGNGESIWNLEHPTQYGANLMTPFWNGKDLIFCSAAYDSGARVVQLKVEDGKTVPETLWYSRKMRLHHGNAIGVGDYIYGSSGDFGPAFFMAMNMRTGDIAWRQRGFKKATFVRAGDKFIILDEDGQLALATGTPEGLTVHAETKISEPYSWAAPTLVDGKLYVRDRKHIMAFDVG
jgi:outer membrane protein assembly factor BamB